MFELLAEIATGPTARVELCRVREPYELAGRLVAVKRLHPHIAEDPQFYSMFADEVWMTASLENPNVVRVVAWGNDEEGTYLAVELVEGVSLARLMKTVFETREVFTERMVVFLGSEILAGLAAAHALRAPNGEHLRLVHRDLTPGNVLLGFDGSVKIADFGLAKAKQRVTKTLTGLLKGHPQYMAPEQARDVELDGRADLFSLGVLLFELFTGQHPWAGATELEIIRKITQEPPADILTLRPKLDKELALVVSRLLEQDPERRFQTADEVRDRLEMWLYSHGYKSDGQDSLARFVRRNAMRQMRWFERAVGGEFVKETERAKQRLVTAQRGRPERGTTPIGGPTQLTSRSAATASPGRRRWRRERDSDSQPPAASGPPRLEEGDWGDEQIPTVVKPHAMRAVLGPAFAAQHRPGPSEPPLPSFADDGDSDPDHRATSVKPNVAAIGIVPLPPPRIDFGAADTARGPEPALPPNDTMLDMPRVDGTVDMEAEQTERRRSAPRAPETLTEPRQVREKGAPRGLRRTLASAAVDAERPAPAPSLLTSSTDLPTRRTNFAALEDVLEEAERLARESATIADEAETAAKLAAHKTVLAELAADAAHLAGEAYRSAHAGGLAQAVPLLAEAHRIEDTMRRASREPPGTYSPRGSAPPPPPRTSAPPAAPEPEAPRREAPSFGAPPMATGGRRATPPTDRSGPMPPDGRSAAIPSAPMVPSAKPSRHEPARFVATETPSSLLSHEVMGVPVWALLLVTFLLAVAIVVLVVVVVQ